MTGVPESPNAVVNVGMDMKRNTTNSASLIKAVLDTREEVELAVIYGHPIEELATELNASIDAFLASQPHISGAAIELIKELASV